MAHFDIVSFPEGLGKRDVSVTTPPAHVRPLGRPTAQNPSQRANNESRGCALLPVSFQAELVPRVEGRAKAQKPCAHQRTFPMSAGSHPPSPTMPQDPFFCTGVPPGRFFGLKPGPHWSDQCLIDQSVDPATPVLGILGCEPSAWV